MDCVLPGVLLVNASFRCPAIALIRLDLPTLLLPRKAISGSPSAGNCSGRLALKMNSAINITTPESRAGARGRSKPHYSALGGGCEGVGGMAERRKGDLGYPFGLDFSNSSSRIAGSSGPRADSFVNISVS